MRCYEPLRTLCDDAQIMSTLLFVSPHFQPSSANDGFRCKESRTYCEWQVCGFDVVLCINSRSNAAREFCIFKIASVGTGAID